MDLRRGMQQAVDVVRSLEDEDLADAFWGESLGRDGGAERLRAVEQHIAGYAQQIEQVQARRAAAEEHLDGHHSHLDLMADELFELEEERERRLLEWVVERDETPRPALAQIMPWMRGFDDDQRFRQTLVRSLAASVLLGVLIPFIDLPIPERDEVIDVPERFAKLIEREQRAPRKVVPPVPQKAEEPEPKPKEITEEKVPETRPEVVDEPAPVVAPEKTAQEKVASKGILAFRDSLSNIANNAPSAQLGLKARINHAGAQASRPQRNMVTTQASGSSGGINLAAVSRDLGEGGGGMAGVQTGMVESSIAGAGGVERPLSQGGVAGRTDEEIQIVFDRYKAALYRLYNRELRKDPSLQGQIVLELTIEPEGSVSFIVVRSSDMDAPSLAQQVATRVGAFDFGAKDVPAITIVYPIDFLPTA